MYVLIFIEKCNRINTAGSVMIIKAKIEYQGLWLSSE